MADKMKPRGVNWHQAEVKPRLTVPVPGTGITKLVYEVPVDDTPDSETVEVTASVAPHYLRVQNNPPAELRNWKASERVVVAYRWIEQMGPNSALQFVVAEGVMVVATLDGETFWVDSDAYAKFDLNAENAAKEVVSAITNQAQIKPTPPKK